MAVSPDGVELAAAVGGVLQASVAEPRLSDAEIETFRRDGAVCLRRYFAGWVETLRAGVERNLREPGPVATEHKVGASGRFFEDYCNWQRIPEYRDFIEQGPAAGIAGALMGSREVQIFHEHVLIKEAGTAKPTPWHHDMPYYCVEGTQTVSIWLALDPVPQAVCPEFVLGSQAWGKRYYPRLFEDSSNYPYRGAGYETVPDIEARRGELEIASWALEPGDAVAFHFLTLHGAPGNAGQNARTGFSTRWLGDDACYAERPGETSPPYPGIGLRPGERLREDWFPVVWRDGIAQD